MVTLYLPFKNEAVEILDRNGFLRMYDEREEEIMAKCKEFESNIDIAKILDELKKICEDFDNVDPLDTSNSRDDFVRNVLGPDGTENNDNFENAVNKIGISAVRKRSNVMSKQEYCHMMRRTNKGQRELILETIHRLLLNDSRFPFKFSIPALLAVVMRQSDSTFSEILTKIGNGERLGTEQIALIESRFRSRAWCKNDKMIGYNTLTEVATARRNLHKMSIVESGGLPYSLKLAVGYPYMITMNLDVEDGLVNGAIGTLKYIEYLTEDEQVTIYGTTEVDVEPQPSPRQPCAFGWSFQIQAWANYVE
ncbi:ATP-dependent DNA helicase [Trichonephila clavipes]|nr:ATP-dependent DNA helicase [Trichonephila clavipes]